MTRSTRHRAAFFGLACALFAVLATANSGGYRFGVGDQAFYEPATRLARSPELFPHDRELIASQARLTVVDEVLAGASRLTGLDLPALFLALYVVTLIVLCLASHDLARALGFTPWATGAFLALLTLRHRIARTGANTLEGYMHPRQLAFALGVAALVASLKQRWGWMAIWWLIAAALHPTTAMWWAAFLLGGLLVDQIRRRFSDLRLVSLVCLGALILIHVLLRYSGASGWFEVMDADWQRVFEAKDYVFTSTWPPYAWAVNLAYLPLIWMLSRARFRSGTAHPAERRLWDGAMTLFLVFAVSQIFTAADLALAVQLQVSRVFWWLDFVLALYLAWWLTTRARHFAVAAIIILSAGRGIYTLMFDQPERSIVRMDLAADGWTDVMRWIRTQPSDWQVLAHPDHAWIYGPSVRVAASRDVVLESVKDTSISMYSRATAMRVAERLNALSQFDTMTAGDFKAVAARYGATVLVVDRARVVDLPRLYANADFAVYDLR
jgi:hypothetical protein